MRKRPRALVLVLAMLIGVTAGLVTHERPASAVGNFDNAVIADEAETYANGVQVGDGECRTFVNVVVQDAVGINLAYGHPNAYFQAFEDAGATRITNVANLRRGDIVQQGGSWPGSLHTYIIRGSSATSTFNVIDANYTAPHVVGRHTMTVSLSSTVRAYRLGKVSDASDPPANVNDGGGVGSATYKGDRLNSGDVLYAGEYIASPNLRTALVMRSNGNLVLYGPNPSTGKGYSVRWQSNTTNDGDRVVMQGDGNLVVYEGGTARWSSGTSAAGSYAIMQNDGNFSVRNTAGSTQWSTGTGGGTAFTYVNSDRLLSGEQLDSNEYIRSADGRYVLLLKSGGTAVLYSAGYHIIWYKAMPTSDRIVMQGDGNLVMYQGGTAKWSTGTEAVDARLIVQGDGNVVMYEGPDPVWNTNTGGQI